MLRFTLPILLLYQVYYAQAVGEYREHFEIDSDTLTMAKFSLPHVQSKIPSEKFFTLKSVDKIHKQVVSGKNYKMQLTLVETDCAHDVEDFTNCVPVENPKIVVCDVVVYDVPWKQHREVTKVECRLLEPGDQRPVSEPLPFADGAAPTLPEAALHGLGASSAMMQ